MYVLIGWGLHHILLFSFLVIFQFQGGCIAFCQCVWGSDKQNLVEKSTKDATEIDGTLFKRKLLSFYWCNWINLVKLLAYLDTSHHCNYTNYAQCFPYLQNLLQNLKVPEQLYWNSYLPQAQWTLLNNPLYFVSEITQSIHFIFSE